MDLEFNLISLLDTAGFVQGTILGFILIFLNKKKFKTTLFLGLFLILFALQRLPIILRELNVYSHYPELYLLPLNFFWLLLPLFAVYTHQVSMLSSKKNNYWLLYPGILAFMVQLVVFFLPYSTKLEIQEPNGLYSHPFFTLGAIYGWIVGIWNLKLLQKHRIEVRNHFSYLANKELQWARIFLHFSIFGSILYMMQVYFFPRNLYSRIFFLIFDLIIIYWVSYHGVVQRNILSLSLQKKKYDTIQKNEISEENDLPSIATESLKRLMNKIDGFMNTSESFIHAELTVVELAENLKIHPKRISAAINTVNGQNFNAYVNQLRIKKAKELLKSNLEKKLSIEGIGNEVGFRSKSAFYSAFRKETGMTPSKFKTEV